MPGLKVSCTSPSCSSLGGCACISAAPWCSSNRIWTEVIDDVGSEEKLYTYSIITTNSNEQLAFLHDRMPVILENGSDQIRTWLDPGRAEWNKELQSLLKPYAGELECYPVSKDVGKVGNNSASFVVPLNSSENKNNIANFFGNHTKPDNISQERRGRANQDNAAICKKTGVKEEIDDDNRATLNQTGGDSTATESTPGRSSDTRTASAIKREHSSTGDGVAADGRGAPLSKLQKMDDHGSIEEGDADVSQRAEDKAAVKQTAGRSPGKTRSATSNASPKGNRAAKGAAGSRKITSFFTK